jgi:MFS superfamily sulfate permease-like transporter
LLLSRISRPNLSTVASVPGTDAVVSIASHPEAELRSGLLLLRPDLPVLFSNASWIRDQVVAAVEQATPPPRVVALDLEGSHSLDVSGLEAIEAIGRDLRDRGAELWLSNVHAPSLDLLERAGIAGKIGNERIFPTVRLAVEAFDDRYPSGIPFDSAGAADEPERDR